MPYTAADGPPDIDATHSWAPATGAAPPVINDRGADPPTLPWIKLLRIDGWGDFPEVSDNSEPVTYGEGEHAYPNVLLGKTVVYVWEVRARTRISCRSVKEALRQGYAGSMSDAGTMTITPYADPGGVVWTMQGRVQQCLPDPTFSFFERRRAPYRWGGTLSIRMHNPRFYQGATGYL